MSDQGETFYKVLSAMFEPWEMRRMDLMLSLWNLQRVFEECGMEAFPPDVQKIAFAALEWRLGQVQAKHEKKAQWGLKSIRERVKWLVNEE